MTGQDQIRPHGVGRVDEFSSLFPEYKGRGMISLVWELRSLVDPNQVADVDRVSTLVKQLNPYLQEGRLKMLAPVGEDDSKWKVKDEHKDSYARIHVSLREYLGADGKNRKWIPLRVRWGFQG